MKKFKNLLWERRGPVLWIYFNRPDVKNALDLETAREFLEGLQRGFRDPSAAVIVLSGKGGTFSAGGDIKKMSETKDPRGFFLKISKAVHTAVLKMKESDKPILAAIPGYAGGAAFGLVQGCDMLIAADTAQFSAATIRLGLVANGGATYYLPRRVGFTRASEILLLGEGVSAAEALQIGLINRMVSPGLLESETQKIAERLASGPRRALARLKRILNQSLTATLRTQLERERQAIAWSATTEDFKEGVRAFLRKRKPVFRT